MSISRKYSLDALLDSLDLHIALIDSQGVIRYVNDAWVKFGRENGVKDNCKWIGQNYLKMCSGALARGDKHALSMEAGLKSIIEGDEQEFTYEYPCHSPTEDRWFLLRSVPLKEDSHFFVISHQNITKNKLLEQKAARLSLEDPLTGLYNRRGLDIFAEEEFARSARYKLPIGLIIIDVDYFKSYNDQYGHKQGDQCLIDIAAIISGYARRPGDIVGRIGGDEFVIVLSQAECAHSLAIAKEISEQVKRLNLHLSNGLQVTVSCGVTSLIPDHQTSYSQELYNKADVALYMAKRKRDTAFLIDGNKSDF